MRGVIHIGRGSAGFLTPARRRFVRLFAQAVRILRQSDLLVRLLLRIRVNALPSSS